MNGAKEQTNGCLLPASGTAPGASLKLTNDARERFAAGADTVRGVRPEILMSWYRCREQYNVDPSLDRAPAAAGASAHSIEHDVMFAELGCLAASAAHQVEAVDGLVAVADSEGRILASWGSRRVLDLAAENNLAPWSAWSEWASGTNGMGTALETHRPVMVSGPEHWCQGFHHWTCAGVAVRDVVTDDALAVLNVSCWKMPLSGAVMQWLRKAAADAQSKLRQRAHHSGTLLAAAFADARVPSGMALAAVDLAGKVVLANSEAAALMGTPADTPAYAPATRWASQLPAVPPLARHITACARQDPNWSGSTQIYVPFLDSAIPVSARPVFSGTQVIGALLAFGSPDGQPVFGAPASDPFPDTERPRPIPSRVIALRENRWVLLDPREIRFAEADRNKIWLMSDQGRLQAATRGLDRLEQQLADKGFLRVHRRFLVNLGRVREIEPGFKGTLFVTTDTHSHETVPVARRHAASLRRSLGL